jgi:hypothetical protein
MAAGSIDLWRYHDLGERISVYSTNGGALLRGAGDDVRIEDGEPVLEAGEEERFRLAGFARLIGAQGLTAEGPATFVVTTDRIITMFLHPAETTRGKIPSDEVHLFVLPWDLVDSIDMPQKKGMADRIAGNRTIQLMVLAVLATLQMVPRVRQGEDGSPVKVGDKDVLVDLTQVAATHRLSVSPESEHERLQPLMDGDIPVHDGEFTAWVTDKDSADVPIHLVGRLVGDDERTEAPRDGKVASASASAAVLSADVADKSSTQKLRTPADGEPRGAEDVGAPPAVGADTQHGPEEGAEGANSGRCPACGVAVGPDTSFCTGCGASLSRDPGASDVHEARRGQGPADSCRSCREPLRQGVAFCTACGTEVAGAEPALTGAAFGGPSGAQIEGDVGAPALTSERGAVGDVPAAPIQNPADDGSRRARLPAGWVAVVVGATVLIGGGVLAGVLLRGGQDPAPPAAAVAVSDTPDFESSGDATPSPDAPGIPEAADPAPAPPLRERIDLVPAFIDPDPGDPADVCFGPGDRPAGVAWLEVAGVRYYEDVVQCGSRSRAADADGVLRFDGAALGLRTGDRIISVGGEFVFDESAVSQRGSRIQWTAVYDGQGICRAIASWGERGRCDSGAYPGEVTAPDAELQIRQRVLRTAAADRGMWAGVHHPSIVVERAASAEAAPFDEAAPSSDGSDAAQSRVGTLSEDELVYVQGELDRIFIEIKAGDYSSGAAADGLLQQLEGSGDPLLGNAAYNAGLIRYATGDCVGAGEAFSLAASIPGTQVQGALRERAATAAAAGCTIDVTELVAS